MTDLSGIERRLMQALPHDKCLHIIAGILVFAATHFAGLQIALTAVVSAAIAKELVDHFVGGDVSIWDVVATVAGGLLGLLCFAR